MSRANDNARSSGGAPAEAGQSELASGHGQYTFWSQLKRLLVFQIKLYVDAARDILLSPLSALAFVLDVVMGNDRQNSFFTRVLRLGRRTERAINLFEQHDPEQQGKNTVDGLIRDVEGKLRR